jgi:hypothetical protein
LSVTSPSKYFSKNFDTEEHDFFIHFSLFLSTLAKALLGFAPL